MKKIIRLTESDLQRIIENSVRKYINEIGGVYPDGQMDMFLNQDEVDEYRSSANGRAIDALLRAERECGWRHSATKDMGKYTEYVCYPIHDYGLQDRRAFMEKIKEYAPIKDNISFACQRNSYTNTFNVRIKNI